MAKFVRTLSGEFEDIVYSIEDYFTQNENIKLVDKVFIIINRRIPRPLSEA